MNVAAQHFEFDKTQRDKIADYRGEDPSLMFSTVKVARDQRVPGSFLVRSRGR